MFTTFWWGTDIWGITYLRLDLIHYMIRFSLFGMFLLSSLLLNLSDQAEPRYIICNCLSSISYSWRSWDCWDIELFRKMIIQEAITVQIQVRWLSTSLSSPCLPQDFSVFAIFSRYLFYVHGSWWHFICNPAEHETREWWDNKKTVPCLCSFLCWLISIFFQRNK